MSDEAPIAALLAQSFALLARERPNAWARFCDRLGTRVVSITLANERFVVVPHDDELRVATEPEPELVPTVELHCDGPTILAVLDDELDLASAVRHDRVAVRGPLDAVAAVHDALVAYVHAGVRCPGFSRLLSEFRASLARDREPRP